MRTVSRRVVFLVFLIMSLLLPALFAQGQIDVKRDPDKTVYSIGAFADDQIDVKRDRDKTVYTIGQNSQSRRKEQDERDKAWDMLRNIGIGVDRREGQPSRNQPVQPAPNK
jgi:hypothetical protein